MGVKMNLIPPSDICVRRAEGVVTRNRTHTFGNLDIGRDKTTSLTPTRQGFMLEPLSVESREGAYDMLSLIGLIVVIWFVLEHLKTLS